MPKTIPETRHHWLNRRVIALGMCDACSVVAAIVAAFLLRFEGDLASIRWWWEGRTLSTAVTVIVFLVLFGVNRLYHQAWRFAGMDSLLAVVRATAVGTILMVVIQAMLDFRVMPRSIIVMTFLLTTTLVGSVRVGLRLLYERVPSEKKEAHTRSQPRSPARRTLIIGADQRGADLVNYLRQHPHLGLAPVGFLDDDKSKHGLYVRRVRILGGVGDLSDALESYSITDVIIALPNAPGSMVRKIVNECAQMNVAVKTLPGITEALSGGVQPFRIREVQVEDLLRREPVRVNLEEIAAYLTGKRVMVTGGGGSIGSELCRQIATYDPASLAVLDIDETGVFDVSEALHEKHPDLNVWPVVADIRDASTLRRHFESLQPQIVFHAAAYKHVPLMESHPAEAIRTNIFGTRVVAEAASAIGVERFILVSTDKAVHPVSVMGVTKRIAELVVQSESASNLCGNGTTRFMAVRFGNVLASRGSVLPTFQRQIEQGGPVTVTHPDMKRYFMTIPEAVQLVIQAGALGNGGEVFVLDMGEPIRIADLACDLIRLSGYEPEEDILIKYVGIRPGEKLFEEIFTKREELIASRHERIFVCPSLDGEGDAGISSNELTQRVREWLTRMEGLLQQEASEVDLKAALRDMVPSYPGDSESSLDLAETAK